MGDGSQAGLRLFQGSWASSTHRPQKSVIPAKTKPAPMKAGRP